MKSNIGIVLVAILLVTAGATASNGQFVTDKRKSSSLETHYVLFYARPPALFGSDKSLVGHAWIGWGVAETDVELKKGEIDPVTISNSFGFYPEPGKDQGKAWKLERVPGEVRSEFLGNQKHLRLVVLVEKEVITKIETIVKDYRSLTCPSSEYQLLVDNCVTFAMKAATACDLLTPSFEGKLPSTVLQELLDLNGK